MYFIFATDQVAKDLFLLDFHKFQQENLKSNTEDNM